MFGQYGVQLPSLKPWAEIFVVDMDTNNFVSNGKVSYTQDSSIKAGQDGSGILYQLLGKNTNLSNRYNINFQNQGQPLYISRNENLQDSGETIDFRDFISGKSYRAQLIPTINGTGINTRSSFYINLDVTLNSQTKNYIVGTPSITRQRILSYNIKKVLIDSTGKSVIFVIEMKRATENSVDIRYMVEAVRF
jgi:predicted secreted protein